ncbi:hypothetical protein ACW9H6_02805 [Pseudomonas sp. SDO528_S397]
MPAKLSNRTRPLFFTLSLWLCGVALLFVIKAVIEQVQGPIAETWIDLTLVLAAYLMFFLLEPLHARLVLRQQRRAGRRAR